MTQRTIVKLRVRVWHDDDTVVDLSDRVISGPFVRGDVDASDFECKMTFDNAQVPYVNNDLSLDPNDELSTLNLDDSSAVDPILTENHKVQVDYDTGSGWTLAFEGYAGDDVDSVFVDTKMHRVTFNPFGVTMPYKEVNRMRKLTYYDRDLATSLLRSILLDGDCDGDGFTDRMAHVVVVDDPLAAVDEYTTKDGISVWQALMEAIAPTGYVLVSQYHASGTAYNDGSGESTPADGFYLTLMEPLRDQTVPDHTWTDHCTRRRVKYSIEHVRSWVAVRFEMSNGAQRTTTPATDTTSRDRWGIPKGDGTKMHRKMMLVETNNPLVRTLSVAETYRNYGLHDLSTPTPDVSVELDELWDSPALRDFVEFQFQDYTLQVGVTGLEWDLSPGSFGGRTTIFGAQDKVIGLRNYWIGQEMSPEQRAQQRLEWLEGGMSKLPTPRWLSYRRYAYQDDEGRTHSAVDLRWERCTAWWFGYTGLYVSLGDKYHYAPEPVQTTRASFATIDGLPPGGKVYIKPKHFPAQNMSPQGRR